MDARGAKVAGLLVHPERQAEVLGLDGGRKHAAASPDAEMHQSLTAAWDRRVAPQALLE